MKKAIYPGSFDPITFGHLDVIKRAARLFDELWVAVAENSEKDALFSLPERLDMIHHCVKGMKNVRVIHFSNLLVEFCKKKKIDVIVRGLRAISDFEFEFQMALTNKKLYDNLETVFMMAKENFSYLSSRMIKEIAALGGSVKPFVPDLVRRRLEGKARR